MAEQSFALDLILEAVHLKHSCQRNLASDSQRSKLDQMRLGEKTKQCTLITIQDYRKNLNGGSFVAVYFDHKIKLLCVEFSESEWVGAILLFKKQLT